MIYSEKFHLKQAIKFSKAARKEIDPDHKDRLLSRVKMFRYMARRAKQLRIEYPKINLLDEIEPESPILFSEQFHLNEASRWDADAQQATDPKRKKKLSVRAGFARDRAVYAKKRFAENTNLILLHEIYRNPSGSQSFYFS